MSLFILNAMALFHRFDWLRTTRFRWLSKSRLCGTLRPPFAIKNIFIYDDLKAKKEKQEQLVEK